jgi:hypothetical protein
MGFMRIQLHVNNPHTVAAEIITTGCDTVTLKYCPTVNKWGPADRDITIWVDLGAQDFGIILSSKISCSSR